MGFYMGVWDKIVNPQVGTARTSHIKLSPHFLLTDFISNLIFLFNAVWIILTPSFNSFWINLSFSTHKILFL